MNECKGKQPPRHKVAITLRAFMGYCLDHYLDHAPNSIADNQHMNECKGTQPPRHKVAITLRAFMGYCLQQEEFQLTEWTSGNVLRALSDAAKQFNHYLPLDDEEKAAVVDFINYLGMRMGVDWAIYTSDL